MGGFDQDLEWLAEHLRDAMEELPTAVTPTMQVIIGENRGLVQTGPHVHITLKTNCDRSQEDGDGPY